MRPFLGMSRNRAAAFERYIGIDYSGAETPTASLKGLRVYMAECGAPPVEVLPPPSTRKYWTRRGIAEWLVERLSEDRVTLVGIDHAFSFPLRYFEVHRLPPDWPAFLEDFQRHWPTDGEFVYVDFVRVGDVGNGAARGGNSRWRRLTDLRARTPKSVFHFNVPGSVATSTHAGLPWLRYIRQHVGERVHFWPFDGWRVGSGVARPPSPPAPLPRWGEGRRRMEDAPALTPTPSPALSPALTPTLMPALTPALSQGEREKRARSVVLEVYPRLWSRGFATEGRTPDQHDAYSVAAWMQDTDRLGRLGEYLEPRLEPAERMIAQVEGWILGVR